MPSAPSPAERGPRRQAKAAEATMSRPTLTAPQVSGHTLQQLDLFNGFSAGEVDHQDPVPRRKVLQPAEEERSPSSFLQSHSSHLALGGPCLPTRRTSRPLSSSLRSCLCSHFWGAGRARFPQAPCSQVRTTV